MKAYTYLGNRQLAFVEKPKPGLIDATDAIVKVTVSSICSSDLHIKYGSVPKAVPGITLGHEMVGIVEEVGNQVHNVKVGDRVVVNVETFCGECYYCKHGYVNNCSSPQGGWALGCRIDGGQTEYVRVPLANQGLTPIPNNVSDMEALFVGDILATGYWATDINEIGSEDNVLIIGAGPTGICTLLCVMLQKPHKIIVCEQSPRRRDFIQQHYPNVIVTDPQNCKDCISKHCEREGADRVIEVAGSEQTFQLAWQCARPNAIVTIVALYDKPQMLPLPDMYGKNLTFKTGGVDGCNCDKILKLIEGGKIDTTPLITHHFKLTEIEKAYDIFENKKDGVIKVAISNP
ncbi:MAG: alcohol dehydrogenase [Porphyromonadaceae bacterium]|nr:alcohol dehydrogenase [Porphyromonadaceae bacterium]